MTSKEIIIKEPIAILKAGFPNAIGRPAFFWKKKEKLIMLNAYKKNYRGEIRTKAKDEKRKKSLATKCLFL